LICTCSRCLWACACSLFIAGLVSSDLWRLRTYEVWILLCDARYQILTSWFWNVHVVGLYMVRIGNCVICQLICINYIFHRFEVFLVGPIRSKLWLDQWIDGLPRLMSDLLLVTIYLGVIVLFYIRSFILFRICSLKWHAVWFCSTLKWN